jgi:hypothetical protein
MFNSNLPKPQVIEVDTTIRDFEELRRINGQNYVTITAAEGRKLMQRIQTPPNLTDIERVLAKGREHEDETTEADDKPDFILIESKDYVAKKKKNLYKNKNALFSVLRETSILQFQSLGLYVHLDESTYLHFDKL